MKPRFFSPQLATLTDEPFSEKGWIFEEKFDGIRCIAIKSKGAVLLYSRNHKLLNKDFPKIVAALEKKKGPDYVVDGELVAFEGMVTSFAKLQNRHKETMRLYFYIFDLLLWKEEDVRSLPLIERKKMLKAHFPFGGVIRYTPHMREKGDIYFKRAEKKGLEGIIAKRSDANYKGRRTRDWLKIKCMMEQELVIGGFTEPKGAREGFGALLVGYYEKGRLRYAGKVGTGYNERVLSELGKRLKKLERSSSPFYDVPKEKGAHFVRPTLVCEVGFTEWTLDGKLRHPRFLGLRSDKPAKSVGREQ